MEAEPPGNLQPKWFPCKTGQKWIFSKGMSKNWKKLNPESLISEYNSWARKKCSHHNSRQNPHTLRAKSGKRLKIFAEGSLWGKVLLEMLGCCDDETFTHMYQTPKKGARNNRLINKAAMRLCVPGKVCNHWDALLLSRRSKDALKYSHCRCTSGKKCLNFSPVQGEKKSHTKQVPFSQKIFREANIKYVTVSDKYSN